MSQNKVHKGKYCSTTLVPDVATEEVLRWFSMPAELAGGADIGGGGEFRRGIKMLGWK